MLNTLSHTFIFKILDEEWFLLFHHSTIFHLPIFPPLQPNGLLKWTFKYTNRERDSKRDKYSSGAVDGLKARFVPIVPSWLVRSSTWWSSLQQAAMGAGWWKFKYVYKHPWMFRPPIYKLTNSSFISNN